MKKMMVMVIMLLLSEYGADACVGKALHVGAMNSSEGQVFAEILSALITERTGTSVHIRFFKDMQELYEAIKTKQVDIAVENTSRAMQALNRPPESDAKKAYDIAKSAYEKDKGLIWMKPFGFQNSMAGESPSHTAAMLRVDVLNNFPALPRVITKLANSMTDEMYLKIMKSVDAGEKPKIVARDFLKSKKLI